jgi:putative ABC transport system ATP-binding protein
MVETRRVNGSMRSRELAVETVNLEKVYGVGSLEFLALRGLTMKIEKGELVSIVGPSGSGKSTLLNLIGMLDQPTAGKVFVDGYDVSALNQRERADFRNRYIGFIFQSHNLIARTTVLKNVELPALVSRMSSNERTEKARDLLKRVGLGDKIKRKPTELSGGEQQRVATARALINDPAIVLGDEPTGNLDSKTGFEIVELIRNLNEEMKITFILVTHNPEVANATRRIIHLRDGQIEQDELLP